MAVTTTRWVLFILIIVLLMRLGTVLAQSRGQTAEDWTADESMRLYFEAITMLRKNAVQPFTSREIMQKTLKAYLQRIDPFSDYLLPEEYSQYKLSQQSHYAGVGMEIEKDRAGHIVCTPYPESPAAQAGIEAGDILEAVDGLSVAGQSVLTIGARIRGQQGTEVRLTILKKGGIPKTIHLIRAPLQTKSVFVEQRGSLPILQIRSFTHQTLRELKEAWGKFQNPSAVIIDLRGNPGGSLYSAIDAAMLFLEPGKKIVSIKTQAGLKEYQSELSSPLRTVPLYLWQDEQTASAAEVFIAALTQNQRAVSIGKKTFGKGTVQQIMELSDGSALYFTTGYLQTPDDTSYHEQGLEPVYPLSSPSARTEDYLQKVRAIIPQATPPKEKTTPLYLLCFDKDFDAEQEAQFWSSEVRFSLRERYEYYLLQRKKPEGIKFMVCLGPFQNQNEAEQKQRTISEAMNTAMFTEMVEGGLR